MPGPGSLFSQEERVWIVKKFGELKSPSKVRRAFRKSFPKQNPKSIPTPPWQFQRVLKRFDASGDVRDPHVTPRVGDGIHQCNVQAVKDYFTLNEKAHIKQAVRDLDW